MTGAPVTRLAWFHRRVAVAAAVSAVIALAAAGASFWLGAPDARALGLAREPGFFLIIGVGAVLAASLAAALLAWAMGLLRGDARQDRDHGA